MENNFKGVWIPAQIWLDKNLSLQEKCLLVEIYSLSENSTCYATNAHFAEFIGLNITRISQIISSLKMKGYINILLDYCGKQVVKRTLIPRKTPPFNKLNPPFNKLNPPLEKCKGSNTTPTTLLEKVPSLEEIIEERGRQGYQYVDCLRFFEYFSERKWLQKNGKTLPWKLRLRHWEQQDKKTFEEMDNDGNGRNSKRNKPHFSKYELETIDNFH